MLCECGEREATIHEVIIKNGKKIEKHLCEVCAQKQGMASKPQGAPISQLISSFVLATAPPRSTKALRCEACGLSYETFRSSGQLGCPECYDAFAKELASLLERSHEGATHHVGKTPRRAFGGGRTSGVPVDPAQQMRRKIERIRKLRKDLERALAEERYERAAEIRDEIERLTGPTENGP